MQATNRRGGKVSFQNAVLRGLAPVLLLGLSPVALLANPIGGTVVAGSATIASSGNTLNVTTATAQTIINWNSFSIAGGEITNINQPNSASATLNRVTGGNLSALYGTLNSDGSVLLINPNGVLIGKGGQVNTQSFTASTLDLSDNAFLAGGSQEYQGSSLKKVVNLGKITANGGDIFLISQHVVNKGTITAANGTVGLAAGNDVTIAQAGGANQRLSVALGGTAIGGTGVNNQGTIQALKAELKANGNIYSLAVNNGGLIQATGSANVAGQVWLTGFGGTIKNTGTIKATNADGTGGTIETSGNKVEISGTILTGQGGTWTIDPLILDNATDIDVTTLAGQLDSGNVTETATSDIDLNEALSWTGTGILTLDSGGTIELGGDITAASGGLSLTAGGTITATGAINLGSFVLNGGNWVQNANGGTLAGFNAANDFEINNGATFLRVKNGDGSSGNPYLLTDVYGLQGVNGFSGSDFTLANDIDARGTANWNGGAGFIPIGESTAYSGTFNGANLTISGLYIDDSTDTFVGLFSENSGTIENLGLVGDSVTGSAEFANVGGLVGHNDYGSAITSSYAMGSVSGGVNSYVGGLAGYSGGTITSSYATGNVSGEDYATVGGLAGSNGGTITSSYVTGSVSGGDYATVGGLAGYSGGTITSSYATGSVSGGDSSLVGGLVGYNNSAAIASSYATGHASGGANSHVGGLVGYNYGTITDSYWDTTTSGTTTAIGYDSTGAATATGLTTNQMFTQASDGTGFDPAFLSAGWQMIAGSTVPYLSWQSVIYGTTSSALGAVTVSVDGVALGTLTGSTHYVAFLNSALTSSDVVEAASASGGAAILTDGLTGNGAGLNLTANNLAISLSEAISAASLGTLASTYGLTSDYTVSGGNLTLLENLSLTSASTLTLGGVSGIAETLTLDSGGTSTATGAVNVGSFILNGGNWVQNANGGTLAAFTVANDFEIDNGATFLRVQNGDGSSGTPYLLTDVYGLQGVNGFLGRDFTLAHDIDASGTATWNSGAGFISIGQHTAYSGTFNGAGHTIDGLTIDDGIDFYVGLFARSNGVIKNVGLVGGSVTGSDDVGGLVGLDGGAITSSYTTGNVSGGYYAYVGGVVGYSYGGTITSSYATGSVSGGQDSDVGGLVGFNGDTITSSYATGSVSGGDNSYVGGLVGFSGNTITSSYATGSVSGGDNSYVGGLAGYNDDTITSSYATGSVSGGNNSYVGGLVGGNGNTITSSYATGNVSGGDNSYVGGLVGYNVDTITDSYWDTTTSGMTTGIGYDATGTATTTGLTTDQMFTQASDGTGFDPAFLSAGWQMIAGSTIPYLSWQSVVYGTTSSALGAVTVTLDGTAQSVVAESTRYVVLLNSALTASDVVEATSASGGAAILADGLTGNGAGLNLTANSLVISLGEAISASSLGTLASTYGLTSDYTVSGGALTLLENLSLTSASTITLGGVSGTAETLTLDSGGTSTATGAVNVGSFILNGGNWVQNANGGTLAAFTAANDFEIDNGATFLRVQNGDGSSGNPYLLTDVYGLQGVNGFLGRDFTLAHDIDASGTATWNSGAGFVPIGQNTAYSGTFDGAGHTIDGLYINDGTDSSVGLFGQSSGRILNLGLFGGSVTGSALYANIGGLVGENYGTITSSYATGSVTGGDDVAIGGLVGYNNGGTITSSYDTGSVSVGDNSLVGGLAGSNGGAITSSYATGSVSGGQNSDVGDLVGYNYGTIASSYATGSVSGEVGAGVGGLVGENDAGATIADSYWNTTTSGTTTGIGYDATGTATPTGLTTSQMLSASNYDANFLTAWNIVSGYTVPYLTWQSAVYGSVSGTVGTVSATLDGVAIAPVASYLGSDSYYFILDTTLGSTDAVVVTGTNRATAAVTATVSNLPPSALANLVGYIPTASSSDPGSGPSFTLPNGEVVTIPTSAFSPVIPLPVFSFGGGASGGGSKSGGKSPFGGGTSGGSIPGTLAASSGVAYIPQ